jgi:hypothetical protein
LQDYCIDGRVILEWILKKSVARLLTGLVWLRIRKRAAFVNTVMNLLVAQNKGIY